MSNSVIFVFNRYQHFEASMSVPEMKPFNFLPTIYVHRWFPFWRLLNWQCKAKVGARTESGKKPDANV